MNLVEELTDYNLISITEESDGVINIITPNYFSLYKTITDLDLHYNFDYDKSYFNHYCYYKDSDKIVLSLKDVNTIIENRNIVLPDFNNTFLNVISSIRKYYNYDYKYPTNKDIDKVLEGSNIKRVVIMILDGLGVNVLKNLDNESILNKNVYKVINSIYPSTTSAATISIISGLAPIETSYTGWHNYLKEIKKDVVLFNGTNYYSDESTGVNVKNYLPYEPFYKDMNIYGEEFMPAFAVNGAKTFKELLDNVNKGLSKNENCILYSYWDNPDTIMHISGTYSDQTKDVLKNMSLNLLEFSKTLNDDTLVIISADHGHIPVSEIPFYGIKELNDMLVRKPSNDSRCLSFKVKKEYYHLFPKVFDKYFKGIYKLVETKKAIASGYFGDLKHSKVNPRAISFLGDYIALAINDYYFQTSPLAPTMLSHHAGITEEEMKVPLILIGGKK